MRKKKLVKCSKPQIICYTNYNKYKDHENWTREHLLYFLLLKVQKLLSLSQILHGKMHSIKNAMKYFNFFFAFTLNAKQKNN